MVELTKHDGRETVRRRQAESDLKPWRKDTWCIPKIEGTYVARMEDVLDLYAEAPDPKRPVVCFDESPTHLIGQVRQPIPARPWQLGRYDCEYKRNGTVNLFVFLDAHRPWRKVKVTGHRAADCELLVAEIAAWERQRNPARAKIKWNSPPSEPEANWRALTQRRAKSHNPCAEVLEPSPMRPSRARRYWALTNS
jgi:hypothetical protein